LIETQIFWFRKKKRKKEGKKTVSPSSFE